MKKVLLFLTVSIFLLSCSKSNDDNSQPSTTETYLKFTLDGMSFRFDGSVRCSISYTYYDDSRKWHVFRFVGSQGDQFFNAWTNTASSNTLGLGSYSEATPLTTSDGFDWNLTGIQNAGGEIVVTVTNIKDNKYYSGTITGNVNYINSAGQTKQSTITGGEFNNLEIK